MCCPHKVVRFRFRESLFYFLQKHRFRISASRGMRTAPKKLSDVIGLDFFFLLGQSDTCIFACLDTLQQPSHISPDGAHVLHAFQILLDLIRRIAMHLIPVCTGNDGHITDGKVFIQLVEGCGCAAPAARKLQLRPIYWPKAPLDITNNLSYAQEACPAAEA